MSGRITARAVADLVAERHGMTFERFCAPCTRRDQVRPRQIAMYAIRQLCPHMSFPAIGRLLGGRDHTTVLHGVKKIEALMRTDDRIARVVDEVVVHFHVDTPCPVDTILDVQIIAASKHLGALLHARRAELARVA
ncbi:Chromosomal replication initiator protein DnaA [compost metagenome]